MTDKSLLQLAAAVMTLGIFAVSVNAQGPVGDKAKADAIQAHTAAATAAAKEDFKSSLNMCIPPAPAPAQRGARGGGQQNPPAPAPAAAEASKAFDNLYFVGLRSVAAWAIQTSDGIILIDSLNNAKDAENTIVPGLKHLGLDPNQIKYVVITHSHGDHYGGAQYLIDHFHPRTVMSDADWKGVEGPLQFDNPNWSKPPKRDITINDGYKLTLGDTTITLYVTPGHTPGTISPVIPVKDNGRTHSALLWGGTGFNFERTAPNFKRYAESADRMSEIVGKSGIDVFLSNHPNVDSALAKLDALKTRGAGQPNPFVVGPETVQRFLKVVGECARAQLATF
jgi:metallo-beta-lactamase class B